MISLLAIALLLATNLHLSEAQAGICYGMLGNDLPPPEQVISLLTQKNISRIRIYDPNPDVLRALRGTNIELLLGIPNSDLQNLASSQANANSWVQTNVKAYSPDVKLRYIVVGNEITPLNANSIFSPFLLPAIQNIDRAVSLSNLGDRVKVSTSFDTSILEDSFPPSTSSFKASMGGFLGPIFDYLFHHRAPMLVNIYPYFAYASNPKDVRLDYALFTSPSNVVVDGKLGYQNLFDAMLDSVYSALERKGFGEMEVVVSETGWPSSGGTHTSVENERIYNSNLLQHVKRGTPKRPGKPIETYVFALFDENQKGPPEVEKYWGLFRPSTQIKYPLSFDQA